MYICGMVGTCSNNVYEMSVRGDRAGGGLFAFQGTSVSLCMNERRMYLHTEPYLEVLGRIIPATIAP